MVKTLEELKELAIKCKSLESELYEELNNISKDERDNFNLWYTEYLKSRLLEELNKIKIQDHML